MPRRTILCVDLVMNAPQAPNALPAQQPDETQSAGKPDTQPTLAPDAAGSEARAEAPKPAPPQTPAATVEDMSGWAMGGSD